MVVEIIQTKRDDLHNLLGQTNSGIITQMILVHVFTL